jgi:SiaC family regulatory phosphoprotein
MRVISLNPTKESPRIHLDADNNIFEFEGRSRPENIDFFYGPIYEWFEDYRKSPNESTVIMMNFEYFNTSSAKALLELLKLFEVIKQDGADIKVIWHYHEDDEDMQDAGEDYATMVEVPFEFKEFN